MRVVLFIIFFDLCSFAFGNYEILKKIDSYRKISTSFRVNIKIINFRDNKPMDSTFFIGYFKDGDKSLLYCYKGKNKDMKILMKNNNLWVNLPGSKRALRITPIQRLLGEASNGDIAKISYYEEYRIDSIAEMDTIYLLYLKAKKSSATYSRIELFVNKQSFLPIKANYFLISGKHFKTGYFFSTETINNNRVINKIKIVDKLRKNFFTVIENFNMKKFSVPAKYFNKRYLHNFIPFYR